MNAHQLNNMPAPELPPATDNPVKCGYCDRVPIFHHHRRGDVPGRERDGVRVECLCGACGPLVPVPTYGPVDLLWMRKEAKALWDAAHTQLRKRKLIPR